MQTQREVRETGADSGFVVAHANSIDFLVCRERDGDYHWDSARDYATAFPTNEAAALYAKTYVRSLTLVEAQ